LSQFVFADNVSTTLSAAITSTSQTTAALSSSANLPTLSTNQIIAITFNDAATRTLFEVCYVTGIVGSTLTIVRGQEGTTARTWSSGDYAYAACTAGALNTFVQLGLTNGSLQYGKVNGITPGTVVPVTFSTAYATGLSTLVGGVSAPAGDLTGVGFHTDTETKTGFNVTLTGGNPALSTYGFWYLALGN
jgi:hypothetical protein